MRRCWAANQDLTVQIGEPKLSAEKTQLYERYLESRHEREPGDGPGDFLYDSPVESSEIAFAARGRIICIAIVDHVPSGLSAVYTFFDPTEDARSLGTFAVLWELDYCRRHDFPYLYLGYYVRDCRKMNYKTRFVPHEILSADGAWCRQRDISS
jgi:arginine-tRNA-protein transferase